MKGITYCGACADYDIKKHCCKRGAKLESNPQDKFFDDCPLPDAEPVRHGEWLRTNDDWSSLVTIQCSVCGGEWCFEVEEDVQMLGYNYCPGRGCKMDLEDETDDD